MEDELVDMGEQGRVVEEEGGFDEESREKYTTNENGNEHETRSDVEEKDSVGSPAICGEVVDNKGGMDRAPWERILRGRRHPLLHKDLVSGQVISPRNRFVLYCKNRG